jgi:NADH dehydrogenase
LFQPLLYQVAAAGLSAPEIAEPARSILSHRKDVTVLLDTVTGFDLAAQRVVCQAHSLSYDYLVVALGGVTSYFGHPEWAAGMAANPLAAHLGAACDRSGRVKVLPDLSLPGHPEVFVIGDLAAVADRDGKLVPGVSPAAMQMARHVARLVQQDLDTTTRVAAPRLPFRYRDKGTMATIGRSAAVAKIGRSELAGFPAWLAWLFVHVLFLIGFDNKLTVLVQWAYSYFTYKRGARIITGDAAGPDSGVGRANPRHHFGEFLESQPETHECHLRQPA